MTSRYAATLNDVSLASLSPKILIRDIQYEQPNFSLYKSTLADRHGAFVTGDYVERASVTILFEIREYDIAQRQKILSDVIVWAKDGGTLCTNDRSGQKLVCVLEKPPYIPSTLRWTDVLQMTFSAYGIPYWQSINQKATAFSSNGSGSTLEVDGDAKETFVNVTISGHSDVLTWLDVNCYDSTIKLRNLSLPVGRTVQFTYDGNGILSIKSNGQSLMAYRTSDSDDNLVLPCGRTSTVNVSASSVVAVACYARGWWL